MNTTTSEFGPHMIPSYDELVPFDPDEFATAFQWAMNAVSGKAYIQDPASLKITLPDEDGEPLNYRVVDRMETRIIMAMLERYGRDDPAKYHSAIARIFALLQLVNEGGLEPWIRQAPGGDEVIAGSVLAAAAVVPLNELLQFPVLAFMRKVRQIDEGGGASGFGPPAE
jgi:hypothetical protein